MKSMEKVASRLEDVRVELARLSGTPRSDRVVHNRKSALYARRKRLMAIAAREMGRGP